MSAAHTCEPRLGQVGNQRDALSTLAVATLLDAMAAAPRLTKLKLGPVRDEAQRRRHQLLTMEAVERARRERAGSPEPRRREKSPENELKRRAARCCTSSTNPNPNPNPITLTL